MKTAKSGVDHVSPPANYADLFSSYYPYVKSLARKYGIHTDRVEDVAQDILFRLMERGILEIFDPTLVFVHNGKERPSNFRSFFTQLVLKYLRGHMDRQRRLADRERQICDVPVAGTDETWAEVFGGMEPSCENDVIDRLDEAEIVAEMREYIATVPRRSAFDTCDLVALFDEVVRQIREYGEWNINMLRQTFPISVTAMHAWMWWLRENLAAAMNRPVPRKRPQTRKATS